MDRSAVIGTGGYGPDAAGRVTARQPVKIPMTPDAQDKDAGTASEVRLGRKAEPQSDPHDHRHEASHPQIAVTDGDDANEYPLDYQEQDRYQKDEPPPLLPELRVMDAGGVVSWEYANAETASETAEPVEYASLNINLTGPDGLRIEERFERWEAAEIDEALPDGSYSWEAYATPEVSQETRVRMREIRTVGNLETENELIEELRRNGELPTERQIEAGKRYGHFTVKNGYIVQNDMVEN